MANVVLIDDNINGGKMRYRHLIGREFVMGKYDCYDILRQFYLDNLSIELTNYARHNDWWLEQDSDFYINNYKNEGFRLLEDAQLSDLRPFDVMLIAIPDSRNLKTVKTNHCAIYLGEGKILHHRLGHRSEAIEYRASMRNLTTHIIRHKDVPDFSKPKQTALDVLDLILPHKRQLLMGAENEGQNS